MKIFLLRHGQTEGNRRGCYNGRTDDPLCEEGFSQAQKVGVLPGVSEVYVSPMLRARQTAAVCFPNAEQVVVPDLREMDFGDFEGRTADEMAEDQAYRAWVDGNCEGCCPNGESIGGFRLRVAIAFAGVVQKAMDAGKQTLCIVAHGGTLMAVMSMFVKESNSYYDWHVKNCCGWQAVLDEEAWPHCLRLREYVCFERFPDEENV